MMQEQRDYPFLFSIIMAVYNVDQYLEEAIESVIQQTLNFEKHVEIILVNDGSPDNSEEICLKYCNKYPSNVRYIKKENGGVSSARNEGIKHARGKYVNFMDPDDKLSEESLEKVYLFFEKNYEDIDLIAIPLFLFEGKNGPHALNYKFSKTRVIDISEEYSCIQLSSSSAFIKLEVIKKYTFNEALKYAEDADVVSKVILEKGKYGVVNEARYLYRKRYSGTSSTQTGPEDKKWYIDYLDDFSLNLLKYTEKNYGKSRYIMYLVMYDLQWRLNQSKVSKEIINDETIDDFFLKITEILNYIDDSVILSQKHLNIHRKKFLLDLKYKNKKEYIHLSNDVLIKYNGNLISRLRDQNITIEILELIDNSTIMIEGLFGSLFHKNEVKICVDIDHEIYVAEDIDRPHENICSLNRIVKEYKGFRIKLPLKGNHNSFGFRVEIDGTRVPVKINAGKHAKLQTSFKHHYTQNGDFLVYIRNESVLFVEKCSFVKKAKFEFKYIKELYKRNEIGSRKAIIARMIYFILKLFYRRPIWLFVDRIDRAGDNAEHLFLYAVGKKDGVNKYFVIHPSSDDYNRLKKRGKILKYGSYKHKMMHLLCSKLISSHADDGTLNPFHSLEKYYCDIIHYDFVFLQHGVILHDLSWWLNKYQKNIKLFITTSEKEYMSIMNDGYFYSGDVVKLTGLPRHDNLSSNKNRTITRTILLMPTWRKALVSKQDPITGKRLYNDTFKQSSYFHELNGLINDHDLIELLKRYGYKLVFVPHHNVLQQMKDFKLHEKARDYIVLYTDTNFNYQSLFRDCDLLITDYSSVAFEIAYLRKPVIYYHFDNNHIDPGYFNYNDMGFGEICNDRRTLIKVIEENLKTNCKINPKYLERIESFFKYQDSNNCKRVYEAIRLMCK